MTLSNFKAFSLAATGALLSISQPASADVNDIISANTQIGAQFVTTDIDYTETSKEGVKADTERGYIPGFGVSLSVMKNLILGNDYFAFQFSQVHGDTHYIGSSAVPFLLNSNISNAYGSLTQDNRASLIDFSGRFGKGFELTDTLLATPYVEIGHHNWNRKIISTTPLLVPGALPGSLGSTEDYNNYYYGFGSMLQFSPIRNLVLTANAMVGSTFSSTMKSSGVTQIVTGIGPNGEAGTVNLGSSVFYKVGLGFDYAVYKNFHVNAAAEYVGFDYGRSIMTGPSASYYEPDSQTNYTTVKAGIGYAF